MEDGKNRKILKLAVLIAIFLFVITTFLSIYNISSIFDIKTYKYESEQKTVSLFPSASDSESTYYLEVLPGSSIFGGDTNDGGGAGGGVLDEDYFNDPTVFDGAGTWGVVDQIGLFDNLSGFIYPGISDSYHFTIKNNSTYILNIYTILFEEITEETAVPFEIRFTVGGEIYYSDFDGDEISQDMLTIPPESTIDCEIYWLWPSDNDETDMLIALRNNLDCTVQISIECGT